VHIKLNISKYILFYLNIFSDILILKIRQKKKKKIYISLEIQNRVFQFKFKNFNSESKQTNKQTSKQTNKQTKCKNLYKWKNIFLWTITQITRKLFWNTNQLFNRPYRSLPYASPDFFSKIIKFEKFELSSLQYAYCVVMIETFFKLSEYVYTTVQRRPLETCLQFLSLKLWQTDFFLLPDFCAKAAPDLLH